MAKISRLRCKSSDRVMFLSSAKNKKDSSSDLDGFLCREGDAAGMVCLVCSVADGTYFLASLT